MHKIHIGREESDFIVKGEKELVRINHACITRVTKKKKKRNTLEDACETRQKQSAVLKSALFFFSFIPSALPSPPCVPPSSPG